MHPKLLTYFLIVISITKVSTEDCISLEAVSTAAYSYGGDLFSLSANYDLLFPNETTFFHFSNVSITYLYSPLKIFTIEPIFNEKMLLDTDNNFDFILPVNITAIDLRATLYIDDSENEYDTVISILIVDEGSFSLTDGSLFTVDQPTISTTNSATGIELIQVNVVYTCKAFKNSTAPPQITSPPCNSFKSRSTVYDISDNYKIVTTAKINYTLTDGYINVNSESTGAVEYPILWLNDFYVCDMGNCRFDYDTTYDGKYIFLLDYLQEAKVNFDYNGAIIIGRLIRKDDQILMENGKAFTLENDCEYFNANLTSIFVSTSEFCCTGFETQ